MRAEVTIIRASFAPRPGPDGVPLERHDRKNSPVGLSVEPFSRSSAANSADRFIGIGNVQCRGPIDDFCICRPSQSQPGRIGTRGHYDERYQDRWSGRS
jgi:hypothetical protein